MTADADADVRNWATFGLGSLSEANTKEIRAALWARVDDPHDETRGEALLGLARRKVQEVVPYLVRDLERDNLDLISPLRPAPEATDVFPQPEFLAPLLQTLDATGDNNYRITATIAKIRKITAEIGPCFPF